MIKTTRKKNQLTNSSKANPSTGSGSTISSTSSRSTTMEELLKKAQSSFTSLSKGQTVGGKITKLTPAEILIDINAKTEAVVLEKDKRILKHLLSSIKVGDEVTASVLNPESDMGYPVVSLRRFLDDITFENLQNLKSVKKPLEVLVEGRTGGGFLVATNEGISGFLPNSQVSFGESQQDLIGRKISVVVLEINRSIRKIIFSQKATIGVEDFEKTIKSLKIGQKTTSLITNMTPFGIFVSIPASPTAIQGGPTSPQNNVEGLIHISEISWEKVSNIEEMFSSGQELEAVIIGFDKNAKRVELSIKRLTADPFEEMAKKYVADQKIKGKVLDVLQSGVVVELLGVEGYIRKEKIPPNVSYEVGQEIEATVSEIDKKRRRIVLSPVLKEKPIGYR